MGPDETPGRAELDAQRAANTSAIAYFEAFRSHREHTTHLIDAAASGDDQTLCVLGAGNAYDLELERLLARFSSVHLVDIDAEALARARARVPEPRRARLVVHAPIDVSGLFHDIARFAQMRVTPQDLVALPATAAQRAAAALPGPFDVVASTCLLTQLQLTLVRLLGDQHRLFAALRELLSLSHLRVLAALSKPGGRALLITDLCEAGPLVNVDSLTESMDSLVATGHVIHSSHPVLIEHTLRGDPLLRRAFADAARSAPWLWQNGPERRFIVYGFTLPRRD